MSAQQPDGEAVVDRYAGLVYRLAFARTRSRDAAGEVFQEVFLRYVSRRPAFESGEHEKAWFIRVTLNACRDLLRGFFRSRTVSIHQLPDIPADVPEEHREVLEAVAALPDRYREAVYLHYYEGYSAPEIGRLLGRNPNTVYTLLTRARTLLKDRLGGDGYGG